MEKFNLGAILIDENDPTTEIDTSVENGNNIESVYRNLWGNIIKLTLPQLIEELKKRKLKTQGTHPQLKSRLIRYLKGTYHDSDKMSDRIPFCKPIKFAGAIHENVDSFIHKYNKASNINGWTPEQKTSFLTIYLQGTASTFLENFEQINPNATWYLIEEALRLEFEPTAQKHLLRTMIEKRKQLPDESIASYINDIENLCKRVDANMDSFTLYLKGLNPKLLDI